MKKEKPDDYIRLLHIRDAIAGAQRFINGYTFQSFIADEKTFLATVKQIEIIGEAVYHLSDNVKKQYPMIPWAQIEGMRHRLVHEYYDIDTAISWRVANELLPAFAKDIEQIINEINNE